jgi:MarR family transcriptional regulator, organic hydroperoxide resistance regulator
MTTRKHVPEIGPVGQEAWKLLSQVFRGVRDTMLQVWAELDLTPAQARLLQDLEPKHPVPMTELASTLSCDASNITGLVDKLEARGLIERTASATDRRVKMIAVTKPGAELRARLLERLSHPPGFLATLSQADQKRLRDLLRKMTARLSDRLARH